MLAKSLLSALMASHTIDLVIDTLACCITPINKQLPATYGLSGMSEQGMLVKP